ncbi:MAG: hypothetical protein A2622_11775 [Bdellovibrionales bacterium RIFCSPHIGHO2_01_FULL_40_29]|nr:MAG: hypothetical protein A2622_11775 [Bdellovibrionales bacterium RIFCSPHIGHO2_01_FULL_40_29]OFZ35286.1 MAG: hypothetical protein A3D17_08770 [Bdellovibrionales bacterium RIFCSPHIGHO2_02_FULL_40_15]
MTYEFYKVLHLVSIILLFSGLVGLLTIQMSGGSALGRVKSLVYISHGVGWLLLLVSGFGLAARLGLTTGLPGWVYSKLVIWLLLGLAITVIRRKGVKGLPVYIGLMVLFSAAAFLAVTKPL